MPSPAYYEAKQITQLFAQNANVYGMVSSFNWSLCLNIHYAEMKFKSLCPLPRIIQGFSFTCLIMKKWNKYVFNM